MRLALALGLVMALAAAAPAAAFHEGDFIHAAKRSQYAKMRTNWRDLTEHHCPRFGKERTVALPIQEPRLPPAGADGGAAAAADALKDYRIQLSFDGDRVVTPWIRVLGGRVLGMPLVRVELRRVGSELRGVRAEVVPLPDDFLLAHSDMFDDFANATRWPKHVLLRYEWASAADVSPDAGLYVMAAAGLLVATLVTLSNMAGLQSKLQAFARDVVGDSALDPLLPPSLVGGASGGGSGQGRPRPPSAGPPGYGGGGYSGGGGGAPSFGPPQPGAYGGGGAVASGGVVNAAAAQAQLRYGAGGAGAGPGLGGGGGVGPGPGGYYSAPATAAPTFAPPPAFKAGSHVD